MMDDKTMNDFIIIPEAIFTNSNIVMKFEEERSIILYHGYFKNCFNCHAIVLAADLMFSCRCTTQTRFLIVLPIISNAV